MTHQQIIKLAAQAESEGNYRYADFLDRELVRVGFGNWWQRGVGKATEMGLIHGMEQQVARSVKPGLLSTVGTKTKGVLDSVGQGFNTGQIARAFGQEGDAATGAALRGLETAQPKAGNMFQEAAGMVLGKGNKVITRTIEEVAQAETKINEIIKRISQMGSKNVDPVLENRLQRTIQLFERKLESASTEYEKYILKADIAKIQKQLAELPQSSNAAQIAQKHMAGGKLSQAEMEVLYKEILKTEPTAFAGKSKMRPSDAHDMLVNGKITNANMNQILGRAEKFMHAPNLKGSKWGTGLIAGGLAYGALNYGLPLLGVGAAGAQVAGQAAQNAINNAINPNQAASAAGNVQGGSSTYSLSRDDASVGNNQYLANRVPSSTVASNKTKWIKTSDL